jgi:exodeoxyribonuclease-3
MALLSGSDTFKDATHSPSAQIRLLNWNIRNPSLSRAQQQADWIRQIDANVIILTEAKPSQGCNFLSDWLTSSGFTLFFPQPLEREYCVMVAIKDLPHQQVELDVPFLSHRLVSLRCETAMGKIDLVGTYVPSRGPKERRNEDKQLFQTQLMRLFETSHVTKADDSRGSILAGDLNVVERNHVPHHSVFGKWEYAFYETFTQNGWMDAYRYLHPDALEYSWFGRKGEGYRFDHIFVSEELSSYVTVCSYIHEVRALGLSDHSAMFLTVESQSSEEEYFSAKKPLLMH